MYHLSVSHWPLIHLQQHCCNHSWTCLGLAALCVGNQKFMCYSQSCWEEEACGLQPKVTATFFGAEDGVYVKEVHGGVRKAVISLAGQKGL